MGTQTLQKQPSENKARLNRTLKFKATNCLNAGSLLTD